MFNKRYFLNLIIINCLLILFQDPGQCGGTCVCRLFLGAHWESLAPKKKHYLYLAFSLDPQYQSESMNPYDFNDIEDEENKGRRRPNDIHRWGINLKKEISVGVQIEEIRPQDLDREMSFSKLPPAVQGRDPFGLPLDFIVANYASSSRYKLQHMNSLFFHNGRIYDLLVESAPGRVIRCGCIKSRCDSKYCQCFRRGDTCSEQCHCNSCRNRKPRKKCTGRVENGGCKCVKSGCAKKYCECFQNGVKCTDKCRCCDCKNAVEAAP